MKGGDQEKGLKGIVGERLTTSQFERLLYSSNECYPILMVATDDRRAREYILALHTPSELCDLALPLGGKSEGRVRGWSAM